MFFDGSMVQSPEFTALPSGSVLHFDTFWVWFWLSGLHDKYLLKYLIYIYTHTIVCYGD